MKSHTMNKLKYSSLIIYLLIFSLLIISAYPLMAQTSAQFSLEERREHERLRQQVLSLARDGNADMQYLAAENFRTGFGGGVEEPEAVYWYQAAAEQGHIGAQSILAEILEQGWGGTNPNLVEAVRWYRSAAEGGSVTAQYNLALILRDGGPGIIADVVGAARWMDAAAEQGDAWAQRLSAINYLLGDGVEVDRSRSYDLLLSSALQGDATAQELLSNSYSKGWGTEVDPERAYFWILLADHNGRMNDDIRQSRSQLERALSAGRLQAQVVAATECIRTEYQNCGY